ncbi:MAG: hypothetical protein AAB433_06330 [Nitrospirota bacterium]
MRLRIFSPRGSKAAERIQSSLTYPDIDPSAWVKGAFFDGATLRLALRSMGVTPLPRYYDEI